MLNSSSSLEDFLAPALTHFGMFSRDMEDSNASIPLSTPANGSSVPMSSAALYPSFGSNAALFINVLVTIVTVGQILLAALFLTLAVSKSITKRNPTLLNVILVSFLTGIPPVLLFYTGNIFNPAPSWNLCLTQTTLKNGGDAMFVMAPLALVIELYMSTEISSARRIAFRRIGLIALPYVTFFAFAIWTFLVGSQYPSLVAHRRDELYCSVNATGLKIGLPIFGAVVVVITIIVQILTALALRKAWTIAGKSTDSMRVTLAVLYRLGGYTIIQIFYLVIATLNWVEPGRVQVLQDVYEAAMPFMVFVFYGLSKDVLVVWFCFGRRAPSSQRSRPTISSPKSHRWTMVSHQRGSVEGSRAQSSPSLYAPSSTLADLERGERARAVATPSPPRDGPDAGSHYSWDPRWERASRWPASSVAVAANAMPPMPPLPSMYSPPQPAFAREPTRARSGSMTSLTPSSRGGPAPPATPRANAF